MYVPTQWRNITFDYEEFVCFCFLDSSLVTTALFDREVNCRRAASVSKTLLLRSKAVLTLLSRFYRKIWNSTEKCIYKFDDILQKDRSFVKTETKINYTQLSLALGWKVTGSKLQTDTPRVDALVNGNALSFLFIGCFSRKCGKTGKYISVSTLLQSLVKINVNEILLRMQFSRWTSCHMEWSPAAFIRELCREKSWKRNSIKFNLERFPGLVTVKLTLSPVQLWLRPIDNRKVWYNKECFWLSANFL